MVGMHPVSLLGAFLILLGLALLLAPVIARHVDAEKIPGWLIYVYRTNGFCFITSPLLILLSLIFLIIYLVRVFA